MPMGIKVNELVAAEVRSHVARKSIRQSVIADTLGISRASVSAKLQGKQPFSLGELALIGSLVDVNPAEFLSNVHAVAGVA